MLKNFKVLLFTGILLIIIGFILMLFIDTEMSMDKNPIMRFLLETPSYIVLLLTVVVAPLMEESAFRLWGVGKKWCFIVSFALISCFLFLTIEFWAFIFIFLLLGIWFLLKRKELLQKYLFAGLTSLAFGLAHIGNVELRVFFTLFPIYIGLALILSYLTLRFRFIYSILGHAAWNFTLLAIGGFFFVPGAESKALEFSSENYRAKLTQVSAFTENVNYLSNYNISLSRKTLPEIAVELYEKDNFSEIEAYPSQYRFYSFEANSKPPTEINRDELFANFIEKTGLHIDTLTGKRIIYFLAKDTAFTSSTKKEGDMLTTSELLADNISNLTGFLVRVPENSGFDNYKTMSIDFSILSKNRKDFDKMISELKKNYGIYISHIEEQEFKTLKIYQSPVSQKQ